MKAFRSTIVFACLAVVVTAGCAAGHSSTPPAGQRDRMMLHGHQLVFDRALGVYVVNGVGRVYYHNGAYYRYGNGGWLVSSRPRGHWRRASPGMVPPGLARMYGRVAPGHVRESRRDPPGGEGGREDSRGRDPTPVPPDRGSPDPGDWNPEKRSKDPQNAEGERKREFRHRMP